MKFPWSYKALNNIFQLALDPEIADLQGEFFVDILSFLPSLKHLSHRKVMYTNGKTQLGYNVLSGRKWGHFLLTESTLEESSTLKAVKLSYDLKKNFIHLRNIRDYIRCIEKNSLFIGKFYYEVCGYQVLIGYFSLEKIK